MPRIDRAEGPVVTIHFAGQPIEAQEGDSIAAALLAAGIKTFRTHPVNDTPRGPLCMMGICFECLVEVDGVGNQQACMRQVQNGMQVNPQDGAFDAAATLERGQP